MLRTVRASLIWMLVSVTSSQGESVCEKASDFTSCTKDLTCSWNTPLRTCHTRAELPKCEDLPGYLCMDRTDCGFDTAELSKSEPKCSPRLRHATYDDSPAEWLRLQEVCPSILDEAACSKRIYCEYDGLKNKCSPWHVPLASGSPKSSQSGSQPLVYDLPCRAQNNCLNLVLGKNAQSFHIELPGQKIAIDPLLGDVRVTRLARDEGLLEEMFPNGDAPAVIFRRATGIKNAVALIYEGKRLIVHDPLWSRGERVTGAGLVASTLVLAHELGHHICKHTAGTMTTSSRQKELEADRVAGSILRKMADTQESVVESLDQVLHVAGQMFAVAASASHPSRDDRIQAISEGWTSGHNCNNR